MAAGKPIESKLKPRCLKQLQLRRSPLNQNLKAVSNPLLAGPLDKFSGNVP